MAIKPRITGKPTYRLRLNPQMKLDLHLLQMPLVKLKQSLRQEVEENPLLEAENLQVSAKEKENLEQDFDSYDSERVGPDTYHDPDADKKKQYAQSLIQKPTTLADHLLQQLHVTISDPADRTLGEFIVGNIDDDGYLRVSLEEICTETGSDTARAQKILFLIQTFDPAGVASRSLRECLLLQLKLKKQQASPEYRIVDKCLGLLEKRRFDAIAKEIKIPLKKVKEAVQRIARLEPKPGRSFSAEQTVLLSADVVLSRSRQGFEVNPNSAELPRLSLNKKYQKMIKQKDTPEDARNYLQERLKSARSLISALQRRQQTVQKVVEAIVDMQKDFLDEGAAKLQPMTLKQIAQAAGKDASTVSRAINNKNLQTPWGILPLRYFLSWGVKQEGGQNLSAKAIKSQITDLIAGEDKQHPLSDREISRRLKQSGIAISRRAVTKYRKQLKLLSSASRRR